MLAVVAEECAVPAVGVPEQAAAHVPVNETSNLVPPPVAERLPGYVPDVDGALKRTGMVSEETTPPEYEML